MDITFFSFAQLQQHIEKAQVAADDSIGEALLAVAKRVLRNAKARVGHYKRADGFYGAWPQLSDVTKELRVKAGFSENEPLLRTGKLRDSYEAERIGKYAAGVGSELGAALGHEIGVPDNPIANFGPIPARPVLGPSVYKDEKNLIKTAGELWYQSLFQARTIRAENEWDTFTNINHFAEEAE